MAYPEMHPREPKSLKAKGVANGDTWGVYERVAALRVAAQSLPYESENLE